MTRVMKPFDLQALSIFLCIKVALVTEKTLPTLIQTNETKKTTQIDAFFESKPKIDAFLKIDANAQRQELFTPIYPYRSSQKGKGTVQDHMYSLWRLSDKIIFREIFWSLNAETHPVFDEEFLF